MTANHGQRLIALDTFRGLTIFLMIVVNTPGGPGLPYATLAHAEWNGCTLADLVFPSFLFAMGNAMIFTSRKWASLPNGRVVYLIMRRAVLIFLIGYLLSWYATMSGVPEQIRFVHFSETRIMAVLQRIALCYLIAALIIRFFSLRLQIITCIVFLAGYWIVLLLFGTNGNPFSEEGNAVRRLDLMILGEKHMYREHGLVFDPEGLLSTIPATVNVLIGYFAGLWLTQERKFRKTAGTMAMAALIIIVGALVWNTVFPFNKKLWTSSFVLFTSGIDLLVLAVLFYVTEIKNVRHGVKFFTVLGKNPLFIYVLSTLLLIFLIWHINADMLFIDWINIAFFQKIASGPLGSLLFALSFTMFCWTIAWLLDKKNIYIRI